MIGISRLKRWPATAAGAIMALLLVAGCGRGDNRSARSVSTEPPTKTAARQGTGPTETASEKIATDSTVVPNDSTAATNEWFPLEPGYQSVREGRLNRGHRKLEHRRVFTVTNVTKEIDGKRAILVLDQDFDGGEIAEQALDYLSIDTSGNVLYLGSYTESYEGGQFVNAADAWLAGVRDAVAGTLVPGAPRTGSPSFVQVDVPGQEKSSAKVVRTGEKACVPFKCYENVLVIQEGDEWKYFAPGVGGIKTEPRSSGGEQETEELINLTRLSAQALTEISAEALKLDQHARQTAPKVFGNSKPAEQPR